MSNPIGPQQPQAFIGGPAYHPTATPISRTEDVRVGYGAAKLTGRLVAHADGTVAIDAKSAQLLPGNDNTIDLRQPVRDGAPWYLDCRPGGLCARRPNGASGGVRFRALGRVRLLLGCLPGPVQFTFEAAGNGLFRLYPQSGDKRTAPGG